MIINNGKLTFPGKFKGSNGQEYGLTTPGLNMYFDDLNATPVSDLPYSPSAVPAIESTGPFK